MKTGGKSPTSPEIQPWATLLVLQASPFCNINCDYCYLPNRTSGRRMNRGVLESSIEKTYASDLVRDELNNHLACGRTAGRPNLVVRGGHRCDFTRGTGRGEYRSFHPVQWHLVEPGLVRLYQEARHPHWAKHRWSRLSARHAPQEPSREGHARCCDARLAAVERQRHHSMSSQ